MFPSPCGVLVLKLYGGRVCRHSDACFRPLAGFSFLNFLRAKLDEYANIGFRPLAGFSFLNYGDNASKEFELYVSVPLRGSRS